VTRLTVLSFLLALAIVLPGQAQEAAETAPAVTTASFDFGTVDSAEVLATAADGSQLTRHLSDVFVLVIGWAFDTSPTERQALALRTGLGAAWPEMGANDVAEFAELVGVPDAVASLSEADRDKLRTDLAGALVNEAEAAPEHPLWAAVLDVAARSRAVVAGEGTEAELTAQSVDAFVELMLFQIAKASGQDVALSEEEFLSLERAVVEGAKGSPPEDLASLAEVDTLWGQLRLAWAEADEGTRQSTVAAWSETLRASLPPEVATPPAADGSTTLSPTAAHFLSQNYAAMSNFLRATHENNMAIINNFR
jgi:hypothetical protein